MNHRLRLRWLARWLAALIRGVGGKALRIRRWEAQDETGAMARLGFDIDESTGLPNRTVNLGQPQAGALAYRLGGEVRIEQPVTHVRCNAFAIVLHGKRDVFTCRTIVGIGGIARRLVAQGDANVAAFRAGIACVDHQVQERALQRVRIGQDEPQ